MRHKGRLTEWNDDRGFGFINPLDGGSRVFVHISAFPHEYRRPLAMDLVTYAISQDERGRPRATEALFLTPTRTSDHMRPRPVVGAAPRLVSIMLLLLAVVVGVALVTTVLLQTGESTRPPTRAANEPESSSPPVTAPAPLSTSTEPATTLREPNPTLSDSRTRTASTDAIGNAFRSSTSGVQVADTGLIVRVLPDDSVGARHQRFILRLASGQTLLIAHNIDIAPRLSDLNVGDSVEFKGEYEWNAQGGVIHWTHHDPQGKHAAGWLKHNGQTSN
jgi:cold shock CspA family protein